MRLLKQMIEKKLENSRILEKAGQLTLSYQERMSAYLLSLYYLMLNDLKIAKKIYLWKRYVETSEERYYLTLLKYKSQEDAIILQAIGKMDKVREEQSEYEKSLFGNFSWAIMSYEHEEAD